MKIGTFQIESGVLVVSDPCYELGTWCQGVVRHAKNGTWEAEINSKDCGEWGERTEELFCRCCGVDAVRHAKASFEVGVDSGQAGVFDEAHYRNDEEAEGYKDFKFEYKTSPLCPDEPWYSLCCDRTLGLEEGAGVIPFGAVSTSGYGDGCYKAELGYDADDNVVSVRITFLGDEEEEDEDYDDYDDENDDEEDEEE